MSTIPDNITVEWVSYLINQKGITPLIAKIDLEMVKLKIMDKEEGKGWESEQCDHAEIEYKRFLQLNIFYPDKTIVPNQTMDAVWHQHILDTRAYQKDCLSAFGYFFHHFPYFGMRGEGDRQELIDAFEETKMLYLITFGEEMTRLISSKCYSGCNSSGKCKS